MQSKNRRNSPFKHAVHMVLNSGYTFDGTLVGRIYDFEDSSGLKWSDKALFCKYWKDSDSIIASFSWINTCFGPGWAGEDPKTWAYDWMWF